MLITINNEKFELTKESSNEQKLNFYQLLVDNPELLRQVLYSLSSIKELLKIYSEPEQVMFILSHVFKDEQIIGFIELHDEKSYTANAINAFNILNFAPLSATQKETLFPLIYTNHYFISDLCRDYDVTSGKSYNGLASAAVLFPHHAYLLQILRYLNNLFNKSLDTLRENFKVKFIQRDNSSQNVLSNNQINLTQLINETIALQSRTDLVLETIQKPLSNFTMDVKNAIEERTLTIEEVRIIINLLKNQVERLRQDSSDAEKVMLNQEDENLKAVELAMTESFTDIINFIETTTIPQLLEAINDGLTLKYLTISSIQKNLLFFQPQFKKLPVDLVAELGNKTAQTLKLQHFMDAYRSEVEHLGLYKNVVSLGESSFAELFEKYQVLEAVSLSDLIDKFFNPPEDQKPKKEEAEHTSFFSFHRQSNQKIIEHIKNYVAANQHSETNSNKLLDQAISSYEEELTTDIENLLPKLKSLLEIVDAFHLQNWFVPTQEQLAISPK